MRNGRLLFRAYMSFILVKGIAMSVMATLLNVDFYRALILVLVSAIVTGAFGIVVATIQSKENKRIHERLDQLEVTSQEIKTTGQEIQGAVEVKPRDPNLKERESDNSP